MDSEEKSECIGHVQKRVGSRLRKLKKKRKRLGSKEKLTDKFIDKLQNYYGIAIRSNIGNLQNMQSAVIAAFYHCCSKQCPKGGDSWCKYQRAVHEGEVFVDKSPGLPNNIINSTKTTYMGLCDSNLLSKCLHGKTQNNKKVLTM
ncbi:hypothetical protein AVEN_13722-1 [Araneus ventricosus]|uniref:Mutator-like transposase domain-containing protein n=1 Tax=Araneus ventricosus TaxID=182803 RepID=A0A4Y2TGT7_ARAVE|nr:hypothetical protein AVEN_13722-1 [Araneus ventricosus]